jgi:O-antigen ligase/Tfp pilus assembly protein PilF
MKQLFKKIIENIEWVITSIFLLALPVVYIKTSLDPELFPRYLALSIWVFAISIVLLIKIWRGKFQLQLPLLHKYIFIAALLFVIFNALSSFGAINIEEAIFHTFRELALMLTLFYFYQMLRNNEKGKDYAIKSAIVMTGIFLAYGFYQIADADFSKFKTVTNDYGYWFRQAIGEVKSTLANINLFASYLYISLGFSIYGMFCYKKLWRLFSILVTASTLVFIFILASKAVWAALGLAFVSGIVLVYIYLFNILPNQQKKESNIFVKVAALLLPFFLFFTSLYLIEKTEIKVVQIVIDKANQIFNPEEGLNKMYNADNPSSAKMRMFAWESCVQMAKEKPLLGYGPGQWRIVYSKYGLDRFDYALRNGTLHFTRPHNDFLWILSEVGIIGFALFLFIVFSIFVYAYKSFSSLKNTNDQLFNGIAFSILFGFLLILFVDFARERVTHNVAYLLLFALVLSFKRESVKTNDLKLTKKVALTLLLIIIALSAFNLRLANDMVKGDKTARNIQIAVRQNNQILLARSIRSIEGSYYTLDPFNTPIPYYKASIYHRQGKIEEAKQEFIKAYELHPYHIQVLSNLGTSYDLTNDKKTAIKYYQLALDISPRFKEALVNMAIVHYNLNKLDEALDYIVQVKGGGENPPKYEKTYLTICRKKAAGLVNQLDNEKLKIWYTDENKIKATFVRFQDEKIAFDKILLQELGK